MAEDGFTVEQAMAAQRALRAELGLPPEIFSSQAFVGMVSDEIEQLRDAGRSDAEIAAVVRQATGRPLGAEEVGRYYAPAEARRRPPE